MIECDIVGALLAGDVRGARGDSGQGARGCPAGLAALRCIRGSACLDLAQPGVEIEIQVPLSLLSLLQLVGQDFILPAELGDVALDLLDISKQIDQRCTFRLDRVETLQQRALELIDAGLQRVDATARFVVVE